MSPFRDVQRFCAAESSGGEGKERTDRRDSRGKLDEIPARNLFFHSREAGGRNFTRDTLPPASASLAGGALALLP
jgi:hypothetical protein